MHYNTILNERVAAGCLNNDTLTVVDLYSDMITHHVMLTTGHGNYSKLVCYYRDHSVMDYTYLLYCTTEQKITKHNRTDLIDFRIT